MDTDISEVHAESVFKAKVKRGIVRSVIQYDKGCYCVSGDKGEAEG